MYLRRPKARYNREVYMEPKDREMIRRARQRAGFSQRDLALLCTCTQATISALETGAMTACSEGLAKEIARRLDRDVEELFLRKESTRIHRVTNAAGSKRQSAAGALSAA